jgi:hypothetical protein
MLYRVLYSFLIVAFLLAASSCRVKRKEYIERNGLHSDKKPSEIAKELGERDKKQIRISRREHKKEWKARKKRDKKRLKGAYYGK